MLDRLKVLSCKVLDTLQLNKCFGLEILVNYYQLAQRITRYENSLVQIRKNKNKIIFIHLMYTFSSCDKTLKIGSHSERCAKIIQCYLTKG